MEPAYQHEGLDDEHQNARPPTMLPTNLQGSAFGSYLNLDLWHPGPLAYKLNPFAASLHQDQITGATSPEVEGPWYPPPSTFLPPGGTAPSSPAVQPLELANRYQVATLEDEMRSVSDYQYPVTSIDSNIEDHQHQSSYLTSPLLRLDNSLIPNTAPPNSEGSRPLHSQLHGLAPPGICSSSKATQDTAQVVSNRTFGTNYSAKRFTPELDSFSTTVVNESAKQSADQDSQAKKSQNFTTCNANNDSHNIFVRPDRSNALRLENPRQQSASTYDSSKLQAKLTGRWPLTGLPPKDSGISIGCKELSSPGRLTVSRSQRTSAWKNPARVAEFVPRAQRAPQISRLYDQKVIHPCMSRGELRVTSTNPVKHKRYGSSYPNLRENKPRFNESVFDDRWLMDPKSMWNQKPRRKSNLTISPGEPGQKSSINGEGSVSNTQCRAATQEDQMRAGEMSRRNELAAKVEKARERMKEDEKRRQISFGFTATEGMVQQTAIGYTNPIVDAENTNSLQNIYDFSFGPDDPNAYIDKESKGGTQTKQSRSKASSNERKGSSERASGSTEVGFNDDGSKIDQRPSFQCVDGPRMAGNAKYDEVTAELKKRLRITAEEEGRVVGETSLHFWGQNAQQLDTADGIDQASAKPEKSSRMLLNLKDHPSRERGNLWNPQKENLAPFNTQPLAPHGGKAQVQRPGVTLSTSACILQQRIQSPTHQTRKSGNLQLYSGSQESATEQRQTDIDQIILNDSRPLFSAQQKPSDFSQVDPKKALTKHGRQIFGAQRQDYFKFPQQTKAFTPPAQNSGSSAPPDHHSSVTACVMNPYGIYEPITGPNGQIWHYASPAIHDAVHQHQFFQNPVHQQPLGVVPFSTHIPYPQQQGWPALYSSGQPYSALQYSSAFSPAAPPFTPKHQVNPVPQWQDQRQLTQTLGILPHLYSAQTEAAPHPRAGLHSTFPSPHISTTYASTPLNQDYQSPSGRQTPVLSYPPIVPYLPGRDTMYPKTVGGTSVALQNLTRNGPPSYESLMMQENLPFIEAASVPREVRWGVIKISNIPYSVTKQDILGHLGRNAKIITPDFGPAIHIIMDRATAKTMDCFIEFFSVGDAQACINKHVRATDDNRPPKIRDRYCDMTMSSQEALMREVFPRAKNVAWNGQSPTIVESDEPYNSGFKSFVAGEELVMLVRHAEQPHRSPFSQKCPQRTYESMITTLYKFPWWATTYYTLADRNRLFAATHDLIAALVRQLKNPPSGLATANLNPDLLKELVFAGLNAPGFSEKQRWAIVTVSPWGCEELRVSPLASDWILEAVGRAFDVAEDVVEFYGSLLATAASVAGSPANYSAPTITFGAFHIPWSAALNSTPHTKPDRGNIDSLSMAEAYAIEWKYVTEGLRMGLEIIKSGGEKGINDVDHETEW